MWLGQMKIFRTMLCTLCQNYLSYSICNYVASTALMAQWRHISSESAVALLLHMCLISFKYDAKLKAWDILLVLTSVAGNLCNKCPSGYSNKTAVQVILSMWSLVSIEQQSPRRPCDITTACSNIVECDSHAMFRSLRVSHSAPSDSRIDDWMNDVLLSNVLQQNQSISWNLACTQILKVFRQDLNLISDGSNIFQWWYSTVQTTKQAFMVNLPETGLRWISLWSAQMFLAGDSGSSQM